MAPTTKDTLELTRQPNDVLAPHSSGPAKKAASQLPADPICMEIPVRIQGGQPAVPVRGATDFSEPFQEETHTVILFPQGAVVRLAAKVTPGQSLALTNQTTNQEVSCRVVNVRTYVNSKGFVEVQFAQRMVGFWGVSFPSEAAQAASAPAIPATVVETREKEEPVVSTPPASAVSPVSENVPAGGATAAPEDRWEIEAAPEPMVSASETAVPTPIADPIGEEQSLIPANSAATEIHLSESDVRVEASASSDDLRGSFSDLERVTVSKSDVSLPAETFGTRLEQQGAARVGSRDLQARQRWILASVSVSVLILALAGGRSLLHRYSGLMGGATANSRPAAPEVSAPTTAAPQQDSAPAPAVPAAQSKPSVIASSQLSAQDQPSASAAVSAPVVSKKQAASPSRRLPISAANLTARASAPGKVNANKEELTAPVLEGGAPGGSPSGAAAGALGGIISDSSQTGLTPPPPQVGGRVQQPRLVSSVLPVYPMLAKVNHTQGDVTIRADIDATGAVVHMKVISGPPILHQAAMDALRRWKYEPSRLNDKPIPSQVTVTMKFRP